MTQPGLDFVLRASLGDFQMQMASASTAVQQAQRRMDASASQIDRNFARAGQSLSRNFTNRLQQAAFQVGDFAVQVQAGGNPMVAFTQQASQLLGAFGPWGAVIGGAGAVVGALVTSMLGGRDAAEKFGNETGQLVSALAEVQRAAEAYADAIASTATVQTDASNRIIADTRREFEAKRSLLDLEIRRQQAAQAEREARIGTLQSQVDNTPNLRPTEGLTGSRLAAAERLNRSRLARFEDRIGPIRDELQQVTAEATLASVAIDRALAAMEGNFQEGSTRSGGSRGTVGGDAFGDALEQQRLRQRSAIEEMRLLRMTAEEQEIYRSNLEGNRVARELLTLAEREGIQITAEVAEQIQSAALAHEQVTLALAQQRRAHQETAAATAAHSAAVRSLEDNLIGVIARADSFRGALEGIARVLIEAGLTGLLTGRGALGGLGTAAFGAGGASGAIRGAFSSPAGFSAPGGLYANGAAFRGGNVIPFATGGVIGGPTTFPMSGGRTGLMGEAGPEAIMPLRRGPGGRLGVETTGGSVRIMLDPGLRAEIVGEAEGRSIQIVQAATQGPQFAARVAAANRTATSSRMR